MVRITLWRHLRSRPGILPLGNRHGGRRLDHRHQSLQPARCRSQQDRDSQADHGIREDWSLPAEKPVLEDGGIKLFTDAKNAEALAKAAGSDKIAGGIPARPSQAHRGRRLLCAAGLHRDECRARSAPAEIASRRCATRSEWPPASGLVRASCTPPGRPTKVGRTAGSFCRSPATTPPTCRARAEVHFRRGESGAGPRRLPGSGGTRTPRAAGPSGQRRGSRPRTSGGRVSASFTLIFARDTAQVHAMSAKAVAVSYRNDLISDKERIMRSGNGRSGQDGRQHDAPPDARRARVRSHRSERRQREEDWPVKARSAPRRSMTSSPNWASPRIAWMMVPAGDPTEQTVQALPSACKPATSSSTAATRISKMTFAAPQSSRTKAFTTSTSAPAAASGDWSAATA